MKLEYNGTGENIINVPAHDLDEVTIIELAHYAKLDVNDYIAMCTKNGLYTLIDTDSDTTPIDDNESMEID